MRTTLRAAWIIARTAALSLCLFGAAAQAQETAAERAYAAEPRADLAEQAARHYHDRNQLVRAINWAERMVRSPGATPAQGAWAAKLRAQLKWKLGDLGYGEVRIAVRPGHAHVSVDGKDILPRVGQHVVWLSEGAHLVAADAADFAPAEIGVNVVRNEKASAELVLVSTRAPVVVVHAVPECEVLVDDKLIGKSRQRRFAIPAGNRKLMFRADGHAPELRAMTLVPGEEYVVEVRLQRAVADGDRPKVSVVEREVTDHERGEVGEAGPNIAHAPDVDSPLDGKRSVRVDVSREAGGGTVGGSRKAGVEAGAKLGSVGGGGSGGESPPPVMVDAGPSDGPSAPMSARTKGLLLAVPGLIAMGGGAAYVVVSARAAEKVNQELPYGDPNYDAAYDTAAKGALIGYGVLGGGALLTGAGGWYLLGKGGLGKQGRGVLLTGTGLAAAGVGGWMYLGASGVLASAADFPSTHPEYQRRVDLGRRDALYSQVTMGVGGLVAAVGIWQLVTAPKSSAQVAPTESEPAWSLLPVVTARQAGAAFSLAW